MVGLAITSIATKRRDSFARNRELQKLGATLDSIAEALTGDDGDR